MTAGPPSTPEFGASRNPRPPTRGQQFLQYLPFLVTAGAFAALVILMAYLTIFGQILGYNVSSLDADGPQWPFTAAWFLIAAIFGSVLLGAVWTPLVAIRFSRAGHRRS
ncbi:hypothetical protein [Nesterenkonia sp. F]|uniref:hypothetical protein n=1 Tax=Nesterenkonia sp. F TaxID=795955 RepID=UPI000255D7B2|nr:hypothetical protein [Nesterenkonia sp. F]